MYTTKNTNDENWTERFIRLTLGDLSGKRMTAEDYNFLTVVYLISKALPGVLEDALLEYGLRGSRAE
ncbi:MAG: hypothetical protein ACJ74Q_15420 [Pyrinomonadaceae bacterium]